MQLSSIRAAARKLRSLHFVPGGNQKFLDKALVSRADSLIIDLEDAVAPADKLAARAKVAEWMRTGDFGQKTVCVRINALDTALWQDDLKAVVQKHLPHMIVVPKASGPEDMQQVGSEISKHEALVGRANGSTGLLPIVTEVPQAPLRAHEVAKMPRVEALTWGAEDLSAELGATRRKDTKGNYLDVFQLCRSLTLLAAKGAGVQAIDTVYTDIVDTAGCRTESKEAAESGFDGKLTIHPTQIDVVNAAFSPTAEEVAEAKELLAAAEGADGAFRFKGKMVDRPHFKQAQKIIDRADPSAESSSPAAAASGPPAWPEGPHHGKWFEELTEGLVIPHAMTRTVTEADSILFTTLSMNPAKLHLDYEAAKATQFKKPLVNSMFTVALLVGMTVLETTHGTTIANLGFEEVLFPKPVFYGDSIRAETEVIKSRASKTKPDQGIVTLEHRAINQRGELVCKARRNALMRKRPSSL